MFTLSAFADRTLTELKAEYRIHHGDGKVCVEIIDSATGVVYAKAEAAAGTNEGIVVDKAVKAAVGSERPRTPMERMMELQAKNAELAAEIERLKAAGEKKAGRKKKDEQTVPPEEGGDEFVDTP